MEPGINSQNSFPGNGDYDAELDLSIIQDLEADRQAKLAIRSEVLDSLGNQGIDVSALPRESTDDAVGFEAAQTPVKAIDWHMSELGTGVVAVVEAIHTAGLRFSEVIIDPRAREEAYEVKAHAMLTLQESDLTTAEREALIGILSQRVPVKLSPEREVELLSRVDKQRQQSRISPGPL